MTIHFVISENFKSVTNAVLMSRVWCGRYLATFQCNL